MRYGTRASGKLQPAPQVLGMSVPSAIYEAQMETQGIPDENVAIAQVLQLEAQVPDLRVLYVETNPLTGIITVQFTDAGPGQFGLETTLAWLPQLLLVGGIIVGVIVMFFVVPALQTIPNWVWYAVGIGGVLVAAAYLTGAWKITPSPAASVLTQQKEMLALAKQQSKQTEKGAERATEQAERHLKEKEGKVEQQRDVVRNAISTQHKRATAVEKCSEQLSRTPDDAALTDKCIRSAEKLGESADLLAFERQKLSELVGQAGSEKAKNIEKQSNSSAADAVMRLERARRMARKSGDSAILALTEDAIQKQQESQTVFI